MSDPFATDAGPYVLGALPRAERAAFVEHLRDCGGCRAVVEDLAGLPALLSRAPSGVLDPDGAARAAAPPLPETLLPALLVAVRRARRRRRVVGAVLAAAAAGAVATTVGLALDAAAPASSPVAPAPSQSLEPVADTALTVVVGVEEVAWGTRIDVECAYADAARAGGATYSLVVTDRSGGAETVGTWVAHPGSDAQLSGTTSLAPPQIAAVEVRTAAGDAVLRLLDPAGA